MSLKFNYNPSISYLHWFKKKRKIVTQKHGYFFAFLCDQLLDCCDSKSSLFFQMCFMLRKWELYQLVSKIYYPPFRGRRPALCLTCNFSCCLTFLFYIFRCHTWYCKGCPQLPTLLVTVWSGWSSLSALFFSSVRLFHLSMRWVKLPFFFFVTIELLLFPGDFILAGVLSFCYCLPYKPVRMR